MAPTPEQLKIMEENRRKALEKRAMKQSETNKNKVDQNHNSTTATTSTGTKASSFYSTSRAPPTPTQSATKYTSFGSKGSPSPSASKPPFSSSNKPGAFSGNRPVASFQLISRSRFSVDAPFDHEMIELFKKFPNKTYDGVNRRWTFSVLDHQALLLSLNPLLSRFQLQPLPKFVLDIFRCSFF